MSARAAAYQGQIPGRAANESFLVNGVKFDGVAGGTLLEAKGPGHAQFVDKAAGAFKAWWSGAKGLVDQATRQIAAANGAPIEWHVAEKTAATAIQNLLTKNGLEAIRVVVDVAK